MKREEGSAKCPICNQTTSLLFSAPCDYRKPVQSESYDVYWCDPCDYGQIWNRPTKDEISGFYVLDDYYTHNENTANADSIKTRGTFLDRLRVHLSWRIDRGEELTPKEIISLLKDDSRTLIEIGCGNGNNLLSFINKGFSADGIEPDPEARNAAKKTGAQVYNGTAEELPLAVLNKKYDVVLMSHVLEHCLDINTALSNAKKLLKKGGILIVETPNCQSHGFKDYKAGWPWSDIPRHLNFFTPSSLNLVLRKHDFKVVSEKYFGFCRQFSNLWLQHEEEIWSVFTVSGIGNKPNFKLRNWKLLFKSLFSSKAFKYDSVRLIGIPPKPKTLDILSN